MKCKFDVLKLQNIDLHEELMSKKLTWMEYRVPDRKFSGFDSRWDKIFKYSLGLDKFIIMFE